MISACASSNQAFYMMYSAYKLHKQGDNIEPWHIPFPILNQSVVPCPVLTVASWPAYKFLKRQVRWSGISISWRIFHTLLWSTQWKTLALPMKQMFFGNSLVFLYDPTNLISGSSGFTKFSLNIQKFSVHVWLKPSLKDFEHYLAGMWDEYNCVAVPTIFGIALLWDWNENWTFPVLWTLLSFPNLLPYWVQYFNGIIF